eukprot:5265721-Alexandrium_andersonii.AAC.1
MGDGKKTLARAAYVPWLEIGSKGVKSMIPGVDEAGEDSAPPPPTRRGDEAEGLAMADEDAHEVDREDCEEAVPPDRIEAIEADARDLGRIRKAKEHAT